MNWMKERRFKKLQELWWASSFRTSLTLLKSRQASFAKIYRNSISLMQLKKSCAYRDRMLTKIKSHFSLHLIIYNHKIVNPMMIQKWYPTAQRYIVQWYVQTSREFSKWYLDFSQMLSNLLKEVRLRSSPRLSKYLKTSISKFVWLILELVYRMTSRISYSNYLDSWRIRPKWIEMGLG